MLWTAPPPGTCVPWKGALLRLPRFGGAIHANDHDNWSRYRQVGLSGSWRRCRWQYRYPPAGQATLRTGLLPEAAALPSRYRSLRLVALLVARTPGARPYRSPDAASLCQALRQAA